MSTHTHNPNKVVVAIAGIPIGAYQKDVFAAIAYNEAQVTVKNTVQGDAIYSVNRANAATVTLTVERNSNANRLLSAAFRTQQLTGGGAFPFTIIDNNVPDGSTLFNCAQARLAQMPNQSFGAESQTIEYTILCGECEHFISELPPGTIL
jgi:hypothetical protein